MLRRSILLGMVIALVAAMVAIPAMAQTPPTATVTEDVNAKGGPMPEAKAGGATAKGGPCPEATAGDVEAKGGCKPPPPAPKAAPAPAPAPPPAPAAPAAPAPQAKVLPPSGGISSAALLGLGVGALLVGGGLLLRRLNR